MPNITIGTFNLNNLFSRFNFRAEIGTKPEIDVSFTMDVSPGGYQVRTYKGRLVKGKPASERLVIADRIKSMNVDVLAVQEVEDIDTLKAFVAEDLGGLYPHRVLVEGNDPRLIDLGVLSKYPLGGVTSWQYYVHPDDPAEPVFSRDLLEVEVLNRTRTKKLLTLYNNHLKSHYVPEDQDPIVGAQQANERRQRQAEAIERIVRGRMRPSSAFAIVGDMNDPPGSAFLAPFAGSSSLGLVDALVNPLETRPPKADTPGPTSTAWTHRWKESGQPARYDLYDQIWLSSALAAKQTGAFIDRRTKHGGDGSDHDPAWVSLSV